MLQGAVIVAGVLIAVVVILLGIAAAKPNTFSVRRTTDIKAPPERILALLIDFHRWPSWSPWEKLDPAMARSHEGARSGKGAVYAWKGNKKVGEGRMEIVDVQPTRVTIKLDFLKPWEAHNTAEFSLEPSGDSIRLIWEMKGPMIFMAKVMSVFVSMDRMIGKDFEAGLSNIRGLAESEAGSAAT